MVVALARLASGLFMNSVLACSLLLDGCIDRAIGLHHFAVRPQLHILSNSPATAAVARPSANAPASADITMVLIMVHILKPLTGQWKNAPPQRPVPIGGLSVGLFKRTKCAKSRGDGSPLTPAPGH